MKFSMSSSVVSLISNFVGITPVRRLRRAEGLPGGGASRAARMCSGIGASGERGGRDGELRASRRLVLRGRVRGVVGGVWEEGISSLIGFLGVLGRRVRKAV